MRKARWTGTPSGLLRDAVVTVRTLLSRFSRPFNDLYGAVEIESQSGFRGQGKTAFAMAGKRRVA